MPGSPVDFPLLPPALDVAALIVQDFEANFRSLERWHLCQRTKIIKAKHFERNRLLYQQMRPQKAASVTHLKQLQKAQLAVVHADNCFELDCDLDLSGFGSWSIDGLPVVVVPASQPGLLCALGDLLPVLQVGMAVERCSYVSSFEQMEGQLNDLWSPIWQRHSQVAISHWDRVIAFGRAFLPTAPVHVKPWTAPRVTEAVCTYKRKATRGPDSWDRRDLSALSPVRHQDLANLFGLLQDGHPWPTQLITGFVCPVAKVQNPDLPSHFRPIVLISLLYRIWANSSARAFLPVLVDLLSPHVFGYVPGRRACDLWATLQLALDSARLTKQCVSGYCADLVKCFNRLPRVPLLALLRHFGLDPGVAQAWENALHGLERRFRIFSNVGPARLSDTGFPEGDPLSILAMLAFNATFDRYIKVFAPDCIPMCYVDNIQLVSSLASTLQPGILVLRTFLDAWDLDLDEGKSYAWSSDARQRAVLKSFQHCVRLSCRDLGAQMHYSQKPSRAVLKQRVASVAHLWSLLRTSSALPWFRKQAIRVAIWPKVLHSCETAWISEATLDHLRARSMYALRWDRPGASSVLRWALSLPLGFDPSFAQVWAILGTWWRLAQLFEFVSEAWTSLAEFAPPRTGLLHAVHCALDLLGWTLGADWVLYTPCFDVPWQRLSLEELRILVGHFWQQTMCLKVGHRQDFAGLTDIDVAVSFRSFRASDMATAELVATIQDGTFCTNNIFAKFDSEKPADCVLCGHPDTLQHRCLFCPKFNDVRVRRPVAVARWPSKPRAFTDHALQSKNPFLEPHWNNLIQMPSSFENFYHRPLDGGLYHVFTDGTCMRPDNEVLRLTAWAVVNMNDNSIIADGMVPGLIQTIDAAELCAALAALCWALQCRLCICIHADSSFVVQGLSFLRTHAYIPKHWKYPDLWGKVNDTLRQLDLAQWSAHKVCSHEDFVAAPSTLHEWWLAGNRKADGAAGRVFDRCPSDFWNTYQNLCRHHEQGRQEVCEQIALLLDVAQSVFENRAPLDHDQENTLISSLALQWLPNQSDLAMQFPIDGLDSFSVQQLGGFSAQFSSSVLEYLKSLDFEAPQARYVTGLELLCGFLVLFNGSIPYQRLESGALLFLDPSASRAGGLMRHTITSALRIFKMAVEKILSLLDVQYCVSTGCRPDLGIHVKSWTLLIGWPYDVNQKVGDVLQQWFALRPYRRACDIARPIP